MKTYSVTPLELTECITNILGEYSQEVADDVQKIAESNGRYASKKLKADSPSRTGAYAKDWTSKKGGRTGKDTGVIVYNRKHYQLTHLLEAGHVRKNRWGVAEDSWTNAKPHIEAVSDEVGEKYYKEVKHAIGR